MISNIYHRRAVRSGVGRIRIHKLRSHNSGESKSNQCLVFNKAPKI